MTVRRELNLEALDEWYTIHFEELAGKHAGKAIAVVDGEIVAVADTEREADCLAQEKHPDAIPFVLAIPTEEELVCLYGLSLYLHRPHPPADPPLANLQTCQLANLQTCKLAPLPTCTRPRIITPATTPWSCDRFILSKVEGLRTDSPTTSWALRQGSGQASSGWPRCALRWRTLRQGPSARLRTGSGQGPGWKMRVARRQ